MADKDIPISTAHQDQNINGNIVTATGVLKFKLQKLQTEIITNCSMAQKIEWLETLKSMIDDLETYEKCFI